MPDQRRQRWTQPVGAAMDPDVSFSPPRKADTRDAPDYDRRTAYKIESEKSRKLRVVILRIAALSSALLYLVVMTFNIDLALHYRCLLKVTPIYFMLKLTLVLGDSNSFAFRIATGLACCAVGDACLALESDETGLNAQTRATLFLAGLAAFLVGHVCYCAAFLANSIKLSVLSVPAVAFMVTVFVVLKPALDERKMLLPVGAYCLTIITMLILAVSRLPHGHASVWSWRCSAVGATLFAVSDTVLALNRFHGAIPRAPSIVMVTYYAAQYALTLSSRGALPRPLTSALGSVENLAAKSK